MSNFDEILAEILEQRNNLEASIADKQQDITIKSDEITTLTAEIQNLQNQLTGLDQLRENAENLAATAAGNQHSLDVNFNLNVNANGGDGTTVYNSSTPV